MHTCVEWWLGLRKVPGLPTGLFKAIPDLMWLRLSQTPIVPELREVYLEIYN